MNRTAPLITLLIASMVSTSAIAQMQRREISWVNSEIAKVRGLEHKVLASESLGLDVGYVVWTPPEYDAKGKTRYPETPLDMLKVTTAERLREFLYVSHSVITG